MNVSIHPREKTMSDQAPTMSRVKTEIEPGLYETTYTTRNEDGQERVVRVIEQETLDIPCDTTTVKQEPIDEPLDSELDTWEKQDSFEIQDIKIEKDYENSSNLKYTSMCQSSITKSTSEIRGETVSNHSESYKDNRYTCNECNNAFLNKQNLKRHLLIHEGIQYPCSQCNKSFSQKGHLKLHLLRHEGIKYPCNKCTKSFSIKSSLKRHLLGHEGIKYPCNKCTKSFSQKSSLKTHLLGHEGIKYPCNKCEKSFSQKTALKRHLLGQVREGTACFF
uniref:Zinc finger protein 569 n=1 Tax=Cacopsylla melanoneura TaxID=428564 RepID=A0A8D9FFX8_9HEMI